MRTSWTTIVCSAAGVVCVVVAGREFGYRHSHPYAIGPSAELIALAIAGALVAFSVAALAQHLHEREDREERAGWPDYKHGT